MSSAPSEGGDGSTGRNEKAMAQKFEKRLAQVVNDYEGLMTLQQNHHKLALEHKEKKLQTAEGELAYARRGCGTGDETTTTTASRREADVRELLQSRESEVDLLTRQLQEKQRVMRGVLNSPSGRHHAHGGAPHPSAAAHDMMGEGGESPPPPADDGGNHSHSREISELRELLIQKELQIEAMAKSIDPNLSEACAVQLGVQAISMVQSSMELKNKLREAEQRLEASQCTSREWQHQADVQQQTLDGKRRELAGLMHTLAERDNEIAALYQESSDTARRVSDESGCAKERLSEEQQRSREFEGFLGEREGQLTELRHQILLRDKSISGLQEEIARLEVAVAEQAKRHSSLQVDLVEASHHIEKLNKTCADKEKVIGDLGKDLTEARVELHRCQVSQFGKQKRIEMDMDNFQNDARRVLVDRANEIKQLQQQIDTRDSQLSAIRVSICPRLESQGATASLPCGFQNSARRFSAEGQPTSSSCPPTRNDVDKMVTEYFSRPSKRSMKALMCRLSKGVYLYGNQRIKFRVANSHGAECLEARHPDSNIWLAIDDVVAVIRTAGTATPNNTASTMGMTASSRS